MKKKVFLLTTLCLLIMPIFLTASTVDDYNSLNFTETLAEEEIELEYADYKENDKQATIYLFRGNGCSYCRSFLTYLNSISEEYGEYFKLVSFDVWYDADNATLMEEVSEFLGEPATGVPFIIIGDQVFPGYAESYNEGIEQAITNLYESEEKYDVFEEMEKQEKEAKRNELKEKVGTIIWNAVFVAIGTTVIIIFINKKDKKLNEKLNTLEKKLKSNK